MLTKLFATAAVSAALLGCASPTVEVRSQPACPPSLAEWPRDFQTRLADGLKALPADPPALAIRVAARQLVNIRSELRAAGCKERPALPTNTKPGESP